MSTLTPQQAAVAEQERLDNEREELIYAIEGPFARDDYDEIRAALAPALAEIRRQAAAAALKQQATALRKLADRHRASAEQFRDDERASTQFVAFSLQARNDARRLDAAADDVIAEGWEYTCAKSWPATREDPPEGCEAPVPNEGDYCSKHDGGDDE